MPIAFGGGIFGGGGGGVSGIGASGRLALWSGAGTLTSDAGLTYVGSGTTAGIAFNADLSLSRSAAGVLAVGTGAAGSYDGDFYAGAAHLRGSSASPRIWLQAGTPGMSYFAVGDFTGVGARTAMLASAVLGYQSVLAWSSGGDPFTGAVDLYLRRRAAATLQLGAADSATPVAQTIAFQGSRGGTDTNTAGADATIQGSLGTGTGGGGNILVRTAPRGSTGSAQNTPSDRLVLAAKQVTLTESSATPILDVAVPSGSVAGGEVLYTIRADDATDFQALTGRVQWSAVNKGGTLTAAINLVGTETTAVSAGTLTNTATITTGVNLITINLNAVSSLTQTTLYAYVQAQNNGIGNVTTR